MFLSTIAKQEIWRITFFGDLFYGLVLVENLYNFILGKIFWKQYFVGVKFAE